MAVCVRRNFIGQRERTKDDGMGVRETCDYARDGVAIGDCDDASWPIAIADGE
jgi:hypothetical protein